MNMQPPPLSPAPITPERQDYQMVYGLKACLAVFQRRPQDLVRIYYRDQRRMELSAMLKWAATQHLPYRELDEEAMRRVAHSPHHEGVALAVKPLCYQPLNSLPQGWWLALDNVENPHNQGALLRSAAFFGLTAVMVGGVEPGSKVNSGAIRVSEGGAEALALLAAPDLAPALEKLKSQGVTIVGLETGAKTALAQANFTTPAILVVGHEQLGLAPQVRKICHHLVEIPGSGGVGSLNVSVATGIALAWLAGIKSTGR